MRPSHLCGVIALALLCGLSASVSAQATEEARARFLEGAAAMDAGRFAEAREAFQESLRQTPSRGTAFNLAVACTRTGDYVEAVVHFEALLDGEYGDLTTQQRTEARALLDEAKEAIARVILRLPPIEGLTIRMDGQPFDDPSVDPGTHTLTVTSPRHEPIEETIEIDRGEERVIELQPVLREDARLGRVILTSSDPNGLVRIDGHAEAAESLDIRLEPGEYTARLDDGSRSHEQQIVVEAGVVSRYELDFAPRRTRAWPWVVASVLVVGAGAGVASYFLVTRGGEDPPLRNDPVFGSFMTLRAP